MEEHKLKDENGDGETKKLSSHIVEVVLTISDNPAYIGEAIEAAYTSLAERAERENSLIVGVVQAVSTYVSDGAPCKLIVLTAQRISREDFERQQRIAQFSGGPRR